MNIKLEIAKIVQEEFDAPDDFWKVKSHARKYSFPKKALCYALRMCTSYTLLEIAHFMKYAEHTTVMYHSADCDGMMRVYDDYKMKVSVVLKRTRDLFVEVTENHAV